MVWCALATDGICLAVVLRTRGDVVAARRHRDRCSNATCRDCEQRYAQTPRSSQQRTSQAPWQWQWQWCVPVSVCDHVTVTLSAICDLRC